MDIDKLSRTYDRIAHDYNIDHETDDWDDDFIELFSERLPKNAIVLDLGCGPGVETHKLFDKGFTMYGFDLSSELLAIARTKTPQATFAQGNMIDPFPYNDANFEGVFAKASLLHVPKESIGAVLREVYRVLKPKGIFHVAVKKGTDEKHITENGYGYEYERFFSFWEDGELKKLFTNSRFVVINESVWERPERNTVWLKYLLEKQ